MHLYVIAAIFLWAGRALACPDCATARAARSAFFDERFWTYFQLTVLPLLVLGVIASLLYRIGLHEDEGGSS